MSCSHVKNCELFVQFALNPALDVWKDHYCEGAYSNCVRYQRSSASQPVPLTLLPNGKMVTINTALAKSGAMTLFNAIQKNRVRMVNSMLKVGVDINTRNIDGSTALMAAAARGNAEIVQFLLDHGADVNATNHDGESAYDIASAVGHQHILALLRDHVTNQSTHIYPQTQEQSP